MNATAENIIPLTVQALPPAKKAADYRQRFKIQEFNNPRTGTKSWRVSGIKRDGSRVRENFNAKLAADCRQVDLTNEWLARKTETAVRATKLTDEQIRLAEIAFARLDGDADLLLAVDYWKAHGKALAVAESPRLDAATKDFLEWLETAPSLRPRTRSKLKIRVKMFRDSVPNIRVCDITPETIQTFLDGRKGVSALTKIGDKLAVSRFISWCIDRPRRWAKVNPCREIKIEQAGDKAAIAVLSVKDCEKLMTAAAKFKRGRLAPYIAVCLFGGLRPAEAQRLTWDMVNLKDGEIRIESQSSKTKTARTREIDQTLSAWLTAYKKKPFAPKNFRKDFDVLKQKAGYVGRTSEADAGNPWPHDVMRHTAISHYFRQTGSYGQTAEQFGNSEAIIKAHYQGRVTSDETKKFFAIMPKKTKRG